MSKIAEECYTLYVGGSKSRWTQKGVITRYETGCAVGVE